MVSGRSGFLFLLALFFWTHDAHAQVTATATPAVSPHPQITSSTFGLTYGSNSSLKGQPYSLAETTTSVQTLLNGTTITGVAMMRKMRGPEGRERVEAGSMRDGELEVSFIYLYDPVARTMSNLSPVGKTAFVNHMDAPAQRLPPTQEQIAGADRRLSPKARQSRRLQQKTSDTFST